MPETQFNQIVIADASCLIVLDKIGALDLLQTVFETVTVTAVIAAEYQNPLPHWINVENPAEKSYRAIAEIIDEGEASAVALSLEKESCLLILDDVRARKYAKSLNLEVIGTIGVIAKAQKLGKITSGLALLDKIQATNFRLSEKIIQKVRAEMEKLG